MLIMKSISYHRVPGRPGSNSRFRAQSQQDGGKPGLLQALARIWRSNRRLCAAFTGLIGLLGLWTGCAPKSQEPTITFWAMGREGEAVRQLLAEFEREHPAIRVDLQTLPWTGAHQKLLTAFAGGSTPDVCQLGNTWMAELTTLGALTPLESMVAASEVVKPQDYFPGIWETNLVDGRLYGVPWYVDTRLLFYRRDLLAQAGFDYPPRDWAEWSCQLAAIKTLVGPQRFAVLFPLNESEPLLTLGLQQADPLLRDGGRYGNFESPGFKRALRFYADMFRRGWAPLKTSTELSNVWVEFGRGFFGFYLSGPWNIAEFRARMPAELQGAWMTAPLPGPYGPGVSLAGGSSLVIFEASPNKRAAWQVIEYLSRPDVQRRFYLMVGDMPPRRTSWDDGRLVDDPHARAFREQLERVKATPHVPEWERIATQVGLVGEELAHGRLTVDEAAHKLNRRTDHILAKRRWILEQGGAR
jgi:multiple sugar transport system substrate-binding protein